MLTEQRHRTIEEPDIGYGQLLNILLRRFVWFGGAIVGAVGIAIFLTSREASTYESSMQLLIEPNYRQTIDLNENRNQQLRTKEDYVTQLNLMRSDTFTEQAFEKLLLDFPNLCDEADSETACMNAVKRSLNLVQLLEGKTETRIFEATFTAEDRKITQAFLERLGEVYIDYNQAQQEERVAKGLALVNQQIAEVQGNLTSSRQELKLFRETENLIDPEQQALRVTESLRQIEQTQVDVDTQYRDVRAQYNALQDQLSADPQSALISSRLSQSSRYQQLLNALQQTELELEKRLAVYAEGDPGVQDLMSEREGRIALLQEEVTRVLGEVPAQISLNESDLLREGQLGQIDLSLVSDLVESEVRLQSLEARQSGLQEAKDELDSRLNAFPSLIATYDRIQPELEIQQQSLEQLLQIRQELSNELAQGGFSWELVEAPEAGKKISPNPPQNILLGAIAGIFVGGALAFGREAIDNVVRTSDELKKRVALPLLGVIPEMRARELDVLLTPTDREQHRTPMSSLNQGQSFRDAVDLIYKTIQLSSPQPFSSLMVTSALAGEGKTTLAIGLAMSAARSQKRVLLLDANLRHPSLHKLLNLSNEQGLSAHLQSTRTSGGRRLKPVSLLLAGTSIDVLPAGAVPEDPVKLLSSLQMQQLLTYAQSSYDLVILDAPVISGLADGLQLASLCGGVVMVSRLDRITQADLTEATVALDQVNGIGIIANGYRGGAKSNNIYNHKSNLKPPTGGPSKVWHAIRGVLGRKKGKKPNLAPSFLGVGAMLTTASQGNLPPEGPQQSPKNLQQLPPGRSVSKGEPLRRLTTSSMESGVTSMHVPQWSDSA